VRGCYFIKENNCGDSGAFCISFTKRMSSFDGEEKSANTLVDRGCIFKCAGGNVDTGLCERCYGKIGIDTDCWDLVGLVEKPVFFETSIFLWKIICTHSAALYITILSCSVIARWSFFILLFSKKLERVKKQIDDLKLFFSQWIHCTCIFTMYILYTFYMM